MLNILIFFICFVALLVALSFKGITINYYNYKNYIKPIKPGKTDGVKPFVPEKDKET